MRGRVFFFFSSFLFSRDPRRETLNALTARLRERFIPLSCPLFRRPPRVICERNDNYGSALSEWKETLRASFTTYLRSPAVLHPRPRASQHPARVFWKLPGVLRASPRTRYFLPDYAPLSHLRDLRDFHPARLYVTYLISGVSFFVIYFIWIILLKNDNVCLILYAVIKVFRY